jgi:hypothetical protein
VSSDPFDNSLRSELFGKQIDSLQHARLARKWQRGSECISNLDASFGESENAGTKPFASRDSRGAWTSWQ